VGLQFATNRNRVTDLAGVQFVPFPIGGGTNGLGIQGVAIEGEPLGVYYGSDFIRCGRGLTFAGVDLDNTAGECQGAAPGALYVAADGYPQLDNAGTYVVGNPQPDWTGSLRTSFRVSKFSIGGLLDIRNGGDAHNGTKGALHHFGTSKESQVNRDGGNFVFGETYFGHETVRQCRWGRLGTRTSAGHSTVPRLSSWKTAASSSSARSPWATPSINRG
jgi:hypothetical protein